MSKDKGMIKAMRANDTIVLHYNGQTLNVQKASRPADFKRVEKLMEEGKIDELITAFVDIKAAIEKYSKDKMTVASGVLIDKVTNEAIPGPIAKKLIEFKDKQEDFLPLWRFWCKLRTNPSKNSVAQLYTFIEKNKIPITDLGDLVVEKGVYMKSDGSLWDDYTKKIDNSIGMVVEMDRKKVVDDPQQTCQAGLHVAAPAYVKEVYNKSVIVECIVNPADVVSVPVDYNATKMRVCRYQVVALAKKSSIEKLTVKMDDFVQLPKMEERRNHGYEESTPTNTFTDLMKLTAKEIINFVRRVTGKRISIDPKNKTAIAKKAEAILVAAGKTDLPVSGKPEPKGKKKEENEEVQIKEVILTGKKCNEVIEIVGKVIGKDKAVELAGSDPRRGRFIAKVTPMLVEEGYQVID